MENAVINEAYETINEWGLNADGFIAQNFRQFMVGGDADDNSCELFKYYRTQLQAIVDLGLAEAKRLLNTAVAKPSDRP